MERKQWFIFLPLVYFSSIVTLQSTATDSILFRSSLSWNQTLISQGGAFELGIFKPGNSSNYYVGIWYKQISVQTYVWVANRNTPLADPTSSELKLLENGNLVLLNHISNTVVWSTNSTTNALNSSQAVLGDNGNLVIRDGITQSDVLWQSFDHLTDTLLPGGKIGYDYRNPRSQELTSWRDASDPSQGLYSFVLDPKKAISFVIKGGQSNVTFWSSGPWNGKVFTNTPEMTLEAIFNYSYVKNENESYFAYNVDPSILSRVVIDEWGQFKMLTWDKANPGWFLVLSRPLIQCSVYAYCGYFSVCEKQNRSCHCMDGFIPQSPQDSNISAYNSGNCVMENVLQCGRNDTFSRISNITYTPMNQIDLKVSSADECKVACLNRCPCTAYAYSSTVCSIWTANLRVTPGDGVPRDIYFRVAASNEENANKKEKAKIGIIVGASAIAAVLILGLVISLIYLKRRPKMEGNSSVTMRNNDMSLSMSYESQNEQLELPLFNFTAIATATDEFSWSNKIGQGGFGPVYKGILPTGEEIAIKRLSKDSRQGLQEFMNEVSLIAKLQHRNLVKLLGCCVQGDDRMLIYEYMPNKSLDFFIFDKTRSTKLNWKKRFDIIVGIARGLLYLHRDSRLRIIHRDLKAANVLLDSEMNPKISDFGMARIFGADQTQENTMRVVGTYDKYTPLTLRRVCVMETLNNKMLIEFLYVIKGGYMSPEYATDGLFSMKSDVFSFGVIVLEIVSGERNRGFHHHDHDLNLLGHMWKLLEDKRAMEVMDGSIKDSAIISEVLKCIHVGLLCVQKYPDDRPSMSTVLSMLDGDGTNLPCPKQPGFYTERSPTQADSSSCSQQNVFSHSEGTITVLEGR